MPISIAHLQHHACIIRQKLSMELVCSGSVKNANTTLHDTHNLAPAKVQGGGHDWTVISILTD
jgi:hypothetical protein